MAAGDFMAQTNPSREDFASLLEESFQKEDLYEGSVVKGTVVAIEKDLAVIDVGLKTEGRVALKEFSGPGRDQPIKVGDVVEVYLERVENALGEAVLSRDKARREESWVRLEEQFNKKEKVTGVIFNQVKGGFTVDLDGAVAFLPRSQVETAYYLRMRVEDKPGVLADITRILAGHGISIDAMLQRSEVER